MKRKINAHKIRLYINVIQHTYTRRRTANTPTHLRKQLGGETQGNTHRETKIYANGDWLHIHLNL